MPADWVVPVPSGLTLFDVMAIGTAGSTAALSVVDMERDGLTPAQGPVIVTGATGGVGSIAVDILAALIQGHRADRQGRSARIPAVARRVGRPVRNGLQMGTKPLERAVWAGAVIRSAARCSRG